VNRRQSLGALAMALATPALVGAQPRPLQLSLRSHLLALILRTAPYGFDLVERSTGRVLLKHRATRWRTGGSFLMGHHEAARAHVVERTEAKLSAKLAPGSSRSAPLAVSFEFPAPDVLRVDLRQTRAPASNAHGNVSIRESFADNGERIYGLFQAAWSRRTSSGTYSPDRGLDNRGVEADLLGNGMHKWFDGMRYSSVRAPFHMTSAGYGIYVRSWCKGRYALAIDRETSFEFDDSTLTYFVLYGPSYQRILALYNTLAGPSRIPPDWALGPIWWRDDSHEDLRSSERVRLANAQEVVLNDARELCKRRVPASAMWLDRPYARPDGAFGWGGMEEGRLAFGDGFPTPRQMIDTLRQSGLKLMLWIANRSDNEMGAEGRARGYLLSTGRAVDMRNADAYAWFQEKLDTFLEQGVQGYKIDRGEENEVPEHLENRNAVLFPKMAAEGLERRHGQDFFVFARNLYDEGRKYSAVWNGDSYGWKGFRESVRQALRCALMNFPMWGSDTGGYGETTAELCARWSQFAAYTPMMEILIGPRRTPWLDFPGDVFDIIAEQARTKHDLIPYLRSELYIANRTGMPVMRPLVLAYPDDPSVGDMSDEYLYGSELLVAPVLEKGARDRDVYLPAGRWLDYRTKDVVYAGGRRLRVPAPLSSIPVFVREGAIIPRGDVLKGNNTWTENWEPRLRVEVFPSSRFESEFAYHTRRDVRRIRSRPASAALTIDVEDLGARGQLDVWCQRPDRVVSNGRPLSEGTGYSYDAARRLLRVPVLGATALELRGVRGGFRHLSVF
jgi:alpha-glucosidase (family GH31 glycosyl hydrolase)